MILQFKYKGYTFEYHQPELPWYKRMIGMKYGPSWRVVSIDRYGTTCTSIISDQAPTPALVMHALLETLDNKGIEL